MLSTGIAGAGLPIFGEHLGYSSADDMFTNSSRKALEMINANGGTATKHQKVSQRVEWQLVYRQWKNSLESVFGPGAGSPANSSFLDFDFT